MIVANISLATAFVFVVPVVNFVAVFIVVVVVTPDCTEEEYQCGSSNACIPISSQCDGMPNCDLGEDEDIYTCGG